MRRTLGAVVALAGAVSPAAAVEVVEKGPPEAQAVLGVGVTGRLSGTGEQIDAIPVHADGSVLDPGALASGQAALGLVLDMRYNAGQLPLIANAEVEGYAYSGQILGEGELAGVDVPATQSDALYLKTLFARVSLGPFLTLGAGRTSSTWAMGLLANGGKRSADFEAGTARFSDPYLGDTNDRLLVAVGPLTPARVQVFGFYDQVVEDDGLRPGDEATQFGGGVRLGDEKGTHGGVYIVRRRQEASDGGYLEASALDLHARAPIPLGSRTLELEAEVAFIQGTTDFAPTVDYPTHDIRQLGGALRARLDLGGFGVVLDGLFASGDESLADREQNAFKADRNHELGLIVYRYMLAAQTAYVPVTASNPDLIGVPPEDLDRFPTRGGASNTLAFQPKIYWRPLPKLEVFTGPLVAFSAVPLVDPVNTNFNGGEARNAFDGEPGNYLGTELDLGVRGQLDVVGLQLRAGLEGAMFLPGSAFADADGQTPDALFGGRVLLETAF
ncbi:MAG: hypothetical protein KC549_05935 [Myxococcales bacterium]|nr:hypothetical protein [Myxococcales bacterium]MCB9546413.1 hypothetical protein [Myxococcales bacterium]